MKSCILVFRVLFGRRDSKTPTLPTWKICFHYTRSANLFVNFGCAQKFLVAYTYKVCHNIALEIINYPLLRRYKFISVHSKFLVVRRDRSFSSLRQTISILNRCGHKRCGYKIT